MKALLKNIGITVAAGILMTAGAGVGSVGAAASPDSRGGDGFCIPLTIPASLGEGQPFNQRLSGTYCQPRHWARGQHQVDVLTPGSTYTRAYWDWPQNPGQYSYVQKTLAAGRATFAYDRLGSGRSSHPVSTDITMPGEAYRLHTVILGLRALGYKQVNSIGHSYGSGIALHEAAVYNDPSRVVLTGYLHSGRNPIVVNSNYPANQDPLFAGQGLDDGYITTLPGIRGTDFYSSTADPSVIAYDEAHKDITSGTGFGGYFADRAPAPGSNLTNQIKAPVLLIAGQQDFIFCFDPTTLDCTNQAGVQAHEAPYFTGAASLTTITVPNTGHDIALHPSAGTSFQLIDQWLRTH